MRLPSRKGLACNRTGLHTLSAWRGSIWRRVWLRKEQHRRTGVINPLSWGIVEAFIAGLVAIFFSIIFFVVVPLILLETNRKLDRILAVLQKQADAMVCALCRKGVLGASLKAGKIRCPHCQTEFEAEDK